jgi:hypothetical protein
MMRKNFIAKIKLPIYQRHKNVDSTKNSYKHKKSQHN